MREGDCAGRRSTPFDREVNGAEAAIARESERLCQERRVAEADASPWPRAR
jgi:hypothetical protein